VTARQRPFWLAEALRGEDPILARPLVGETRAELAIVGGGFTGLWTAILAKEARPDLDVVLLEADLCGAGASGRNGGCVLTWATKLLTLVRLYGEKEAVRLVAASEAAVADIGHFVRRHGIDCDWRADGALYTATCAAQIGASDAVVAALEARRLNTWRRLPADEVRRRAGSDRHLEGWYSPVGASVQPGKLVRGLRRVALELGVRLFEGTPMQRLEQGPVTLLETPAGRVRADTVVLGLNVWMARLFPFLRRTIAIVSSDMVISEPAPEALAASGLDGGIAVADSRIFVHYYRSTGDGRLMLGKGGNTFAFGGRVLPVYDQPSPYAGALARALREFFPSLATTPIAASWNGPSDRSVSGLPFFDRLPGSGRVFYGLGYSGNGVGPTHMGGRILASLALGLDNDWTQSPLTHGPRGRFPPEPLRYLGSLAVRNAIRRKEAAEDRGSTPSALDVRLSTLAAAAGKADKG